jgi:hypothetical protein
MIGPLVLMALATAAGAAAIGWAATRRYGWRLALVVPLTALAALIAVLWQGGGQDLQASLALAAQALVLAAPAVVGAFLGIVLASRR